FGGVSSSQDVVFMFSIMYERASSAPMMLEVCITQANQEQADGPAGRRLSRCRPSGRHSFSLSHTHTHTHTCALTHRSPCVSIHYIFMNILRMTKRHRMMRSAERRVGKECR